MQNSSLLCFINLFLTIYNSPFGLIQTMNIEMVFFGIISGLLSMPIRKDTPYQNGLGTRLPRRLGFR
jgi:hypothetical protein